MNDIIAMGLGMILIMKGTGVLVMITFLVAVAFMLIEGLQMVGWI